MNLDQFERQRLDLFHKNGFSGESRWITDIRGRRTYMIVRGEGDCPTILVHGGLSQAGEWALLAGHLPGFVIIPDRPGCGLSYRMDYRRTDYRREAASWLHDLVEGVGANQVDLIGNSMGGFFAMCFALAHPDRVRRLIFAGAPASLDRPIPLFMRLWGNAFTGPLMARSGLTLPRDVEVLRRRVFASFLVAKPDRIPFDLLDVSLASMRIPGAELTSRSILRSCVDMRGWKTEMMMREELSHLDVPTLFLWGDRDAFAPPTSGQDMAASMPDARITIIGDAGHLPYIDQPKAVSREIRLFLQDAR